MSIVVDAARPADDATRGFTIKQSTAETHIGLAYQTGVNNTADAAVPIVDFTGFWGNVVSNTTRH